ncbi:MULTISPECIES: helix-turn-helix transcriptional regulator [Burkholderia]|nr:MULTISPECIES: LuxR C-terminal-related transcriptional regulator [Burkholderia]
MMNVRPLLPRDPRRTNSALLRERAPLVSWATRAPIGACHDVAETLRREFNRNVARAIDIPPDAPQHSRLTDCEPEVLGHLASGDGIFDIARDMQLNAKTISTYNARSLDKLELRSDAALIRYVIADRIVEPD